MFDGVTARLCPNQAAKKKWMIGGGITGGLLLIIIIVVAATAGNSSFNANDVLSSNPLIDGHNDFANKLYNFLRNELSDFRFTDLLVNNTKWNTTDPVDYSRTDLPRLRTGMVGAQFWVAHTGCKTNFKDSVARTFDQIDVIKRLIALNEPDMQLVVASADINEAFKNKRIASLIGVDSGQSIDSRFSVLRTLYAEGVRYMSLSHDCHLPWVESHIADIDKTNPTPAKKTGLTDWGKLVIAEMNHLGMIVDLSYVSKQSMSDALATTVAPVIFSHSAAYGVFADSRNVQDDTMALLKKNGGVIMVSFAKQVIGGNNTLATVVDHIEYIRKVTESVDHIGLGSDFDGAVDMPVGLEDVSKYPALFNALIERGWSRDDLTKLAGGNVLRVFGKVEQKRDELAGVSTTRSADKQIPMEDLAAFDAQLKECRSDYLKPTDVPAKTTQAPTPVTEAPTPVTEAPTPVTEAPTPVTEAPTPVTEAPTPVTEAPTPVTEAPTPVTEAPEQTDPGAKVIPETPNGF